MKAALIFLLSLMACILVCFDPFGWSWSIATRTVVAPLPGAAAALSGLYIYQNPIANP